MNQLLVLGLMLSAAVVPFVLLAILMRGGQTGWSLTVVSVIGATLALFFFATGRPIGVHPAFAMAIVLLVCLPACLAACAGGLLGFVLRRQDDRRSTGS